MAGYPKVTHLGAGEGVTGSCHLLRASGLNILVDCGAVQGDDVVAPMERWPVGPERVDFLFLTHAHMDHIGRVPELIQAGFRGEILATHPTRELLGPMLEDGLKFSDLSRQEASDLLSRLDGMSRGFEYGERFDLKNGVCFRLGRAGHILGSCFVELSSPSDGWSVTFSGDLGARDTPILPDPDPPGSCDLLVLESTYGDALHEDRRQRVRRLGEVLTRALDDGGKVFIPAFALGRTQELVYEMDRLFTDPELRTAFPKLYRGTRIPVVIDSPLGLEITKVYARLKAYWDREARAILRTGDNPIDFDALYAVYKYEDHRRALDLPGPCIVIAGSGMCTGGRIIDHLVSGLEEPRNDVLFVGYQALGAPGRKILDQAGKPGASVVLDGRRVRIRAGVHALGGYSAHADREGIMDWVRSMPAKPGRIRLVHGEPAARKALAARLRGEGYVVE